MSSKSKEYKKMPFEERKLHSEQLLKENPGRVPIVVSSENGRLKLIKFEFLVPKTLKVIHFTSTLRRSINLDPENAIYLYIDSHMLRQDKFISEIYDQYHNEDGFLYINVTDIKALG